MNPALTPPFDVRAMSAAANAMFALVAALVAIGAVAAWFRQPGGFAIRAIRIASDGQRSSLAAVQAQAIPKLRGNFFTLDLDQARASFEAVPWVRHARLRRVWPDRIEVAFEEHRPVAIWQVREGDDRLVGDRGETFEANLGEVEDDRLPTLSGPEGSAPSMLKLMARIAPLLGQGLDEAVDRLELTVGGSWRVETDRGTRIEIGRGSEDELGERVDRFVRTLPAARLHLPQRPLESADLRHRGGYALRLVEPAASAATSTQ